jgi:polar amino acid transport system permease protein
MITAADQVMRCTVLCVIGAGELLFRTQEIVGRNFMTLEFYGLCGLLYFLVNFAIEHLGKYAARRFALQ